MSQVGALHNLRVKTRDLYSVPGVYAKSASVAATYLVAPLQTQAALHNIAENCQLLQRYFSSLLDILLCSDQLLCGFKLINNNLKKTLEYNISLSKWFNIKLKLWTRIHIIEI